MKTKGEETTGPRPRVDHNAARERREADARARREVCVRAIRSLSASELQAIVVERVIAQSHLGLWRIAADSEGIDLGPDPENTWSPAGRARLDLMRAMLTSDASAIGSLRIAALIALLKCDEDLAQASPTIRATHLERLAKWGYTPSESEQAELEEAEMFEDEDEELEGEEDEDV